MAEDRDFMWENLPGVRKPLTTEESEKLGTIKEKPKDETEEEDQTQGEWRHSSLLALHESTLQRLWIIKNEESMIISTINLLIVGVATFSYFVFTRPEPCPRKYRVLQKDGGVLTNLGDIQKYCTLDYGLKFVLRDEYKEDEK